MKKTKVVITIGPATESISQITKLIEKGVDVFRLNFSHGDYETHAKNINNIKAVSQKLNKVVAILQDISGPKVRIGIIDGILELKRGDTIFLSKEANSDPKILDLSYPQIIDLAEVGEEVYFADGTIRSIIEKKESDKLTLKLLNDGILTSKKGVNFPNTKLGISAITKKDKKDLEFGAKHKVDIVALSFVQSANDITEAKNILKKFKSTPMIISKIEMSGAIKNLDEILKKSDGIMVARGDLGAELGVDRVPRLQKKIIKKANERNLPVITATQMLSSMVNAPFPTRAEVSDIANAVYDGTDAVMLSDETTIGKFPLESVDVLINAIIEAEKEYPYYKDFKPSKNSGDAIAHSAVELSHYLEKDALIAFTSSGFSAKNLAKYRPETPIYGVSFSCQTLRKLKIVWGIEPIKIMQGKTPSELLYNFIIDAQKRDIIKKDSRFIATMGDFTGKKGSTNLIRILNKNTIEKIVNRYQQSEEDISTNLIKILNKHKIKKIVNQYQQQPVEDLI